MEDQTLVDERVENEKIFNTIANQYIKQNLNGDINSYKYDHERAGKSNNY